MAQFLTRVELHNGTGADYEALHKAMASHSFLRTIASEDGKQYQLPTAMYYSHGDITADQVRDLARTAAALTGRKFWIVTSDFNIAAYYLNEIRA